MVYDQAQGPSQPRHIGLQRRHHPRAGGCRPEPSRISESTDTACGRASTRAASSDRVFGVPQVDGDTVAGHPRPRIANFTGQGYGADQSSALARADESPSGTSWGELGDVVAQFGERGHSEQRHGAFDPVRRISMVLSTPARPPAISPYR